MRVKLLAALAGVTVVLGFFAVGVAAAQQPGVGSFGGPVSPAQPLVQSLNGSVAQEAAREAELAAPAAVAERLRSRTAFAGDRASAAISLAKRFFGVGGPPLVGPEGEGAGKLTSYLGEYGGVVETGSGRHELVQSNFPLRSTTGSGKLAPISLKLEAHGSSFQPANPLVPVSISSIPGGGVAFPYDVRVAPSQQQTPEPAQVVGGSVFYPGVGQDTDFLLEPVTAGVEASWQLLSQESGEEHSLSFSLPAGASLGLSKSVPGAAEVVAEGARLLLVRPAVASQADGVSLPVSYSVSGSTLTTHVNLSGSVDFPVMVDPVMTQEYGGASLYWDGWQFKGTFWGGGGNEGVAAVIPEHVQPDTWSSAGVFAPGAYTGEGAVTRVDVQRFEHKFNGQSTIEVGITSNAPKTPVSNPVWSYNGTNPADTVGGALTTAEEFSGRSAVFCAQGAGGYDGGPTPLCNPNVGDEYFHISISTDKTTEWTQWVEINNTWVEYLDQSNISASFAEGSSTGDGNVNALGPGKPWLSTHAGGLEYAADDPAFGIADMYLQVLKGGSWQTIASNNYEAEGGCQRIACQPERRRELTNLNLTADIESGVLVNGENRVRVEARDPSEITAYSPEQVLRVDDAAPHGIMVTGGKQSEKTIEITEGPASGKLTVQASDGEPGTPSSGMAKIGVEVDGHRLSELVSTSCAPGPCTTSASWTLNGAELGAGVHTLNVTAEDNAGNIGVAEYTLVIDAASPVAIGPGSVNLQSGDFAMQATDVSLSAGAGSLVVSRHYDSRNPTEGGEGPLGPQWTISLGSLASLEEIRNGNILVDGASGLIVFTKHRELSSGWPVPHYSVTPMVGWGGGSRRERESELADYYTPPSNDATMTLKKSGSNFILEDAATGSTTEFTKPSGSQKWLPTVSRSAVSTAEITETYQSASVNGKTIVQPTEELAPHSASLSCPPEPANMQAGCRALFFRYATATTASGEAESQWGNYSGDLVSVSVAAWNPATSQLEVHTAAEYAYDSQGRLRAEWDPRVKPALKTIYAYDAEGHITAVSPPHQEPWLITYGTTSWDAGGGRVVKMLRAPASAPLGSAGVLQAGAREGIVCNGGKCTGGGWTEGAPDLGGTAAAGTRMVVRLGTWTGEPLAFGFQWERCNSAGEACEPILGAINQNYTPTASDVGYRLRARVTAENALYSKAVASTASEVVAATATEPTEATQRTPQPGSTIEYNVPISGQGAAADLSSQEVDKWGQSDDPLEGTAIFPEEHPEQWPAQSYEGRGATVYYTDAEAHTVNTLLPSGGISTAEYNEAGDVTRSLSPSNRHRALEASNPTQEADKLSSESKYSEEGLELSESLGPEHEVKLADGETVQARSRTRYFYDEGAPENSEGEPEDLGLVTRTTHGALLADGEEKDVRTTLTGYAGQEGLGWKLRAPTSTTVDPRGLNQVSSTLYDEATGDVVETRTPGGDAEAVAPLAPRFTFGSEGTGEGQLKKAENVAFGPEGDAWVLDTGNNRIEKFSARGAFIASYGSYGTGEEQFAEPWGIAINQSSGNVYVADYGNGRIEELNSEGGFVRAWEGSGEGKLERPAGVALDAHGDVWVADREKDQVVEFSASGQLIRTFGSPGSGEGQFDHPVGLTFASGELYVVDEGGHRVEEFSRTGQYVSSFGSEGYGEGQFAMPQYVATSPVTGDLYVSDEYGNRVEEFSPAGKFLAEMGYWGHGSSELWGPTGLAFDSAGELYVADQYNNRISVWQPPASKGTYSLYARRFGHEGYEAGAFEYPDGVATDGQGNVWIADADEQDLQEFTAQGSLLKVWHNHGSGNGQFNDPAGVAINRATGDVYVAECGNNRVQEFNAEGEFVTAFGEEGSGDAQFSCATALTLNSEGDVWVVDKGNDRVEEFSPTGTFMAAYGENGSGAGQFNEPSGIAIQNGAVYIADSANERIEELGESGQYLGQFTGAGTSGALAHPEGIAVEPSGNLVVLNTGQSRVEEFGAGGHYLQTIARYGAAEGQIIYPRAVAVSAAGDIYVTEPEHSHVAKWTTPSQSAHDTKMIYYTAGEEAGVADCRNHPEWVGLTCRTEAAAAPQDSKEGMPALLSTTVEYNMYDQPETTIEDFGSVTRTRTTTYDAADRPERTAVTLSGSTGDKVLPATVYKYSAATGAVGEQTSEGGGTISRAYNTLGEVTEYVDAAGNHTTYGYDQYGRLHEANYDATKLDGLEASETYVYSGSAGQLQELKASGVGAFKLGYDVEGHRTSETYPNGMTASYAYNSVGQATSLRYLKTSGSCSGSECEWFNDQVVPAIGGETAEQESSLANVAYAYNQVGELSEVQETPSGEGCTSSVYGYDEEGLRTSVRTRKPTESGGCATEGGSIELHSYDEAGHLTDEGVQYEAMGNITKLPAADAGGKELGAIETEYFATGQAAVQRQGNKSNAYTLDPEGRTLSTTTADEELKSATVISHYAAPGQQAASWTYDEATGSWTREIVGLEGLVAVQEEGKEAVLQLSDLEGNIIGTASLQEAATKPATLERSSTFGVPTTSKPVDKYSWDGGSGLSAELPSGSIVQDGNTYVPLLGAPLQTENPIIPAAENIVTPYEIPVEAYVPPVYEYVAAATGNTEACLEYLTSGCPVSEEDPSLTLTGHDAVLLGAALIAGPAAVEALVGEIPGLGGLMLKILLQITRHFAEPFGEAVESCGKIVEESEKESDKERLSSGRCKIYGGLSLGWPPVNYGNEICWGVKRYVRKKKYHWTYKCDPTFTGPY